MANPLRPERDALVALVRARMHEFVSAEELAFLMDTLAGASGGADSPVLDFAAWAERRAVERGPMTQDEYFLAQEAFFAAHPGQGPTSTVMAPSGGAGEAQPIGWYCTSPACNWSGKVPDRREGYERCPECSGNVQSGKVWCETCRSWRHTQPCGRDECPAPAPVREPSEAKCVTCGIVVTGDDPATLLAWHKNAHHQHQPSPEPLAERAAGEVELEAMLERAYYDGVMDGASVSQRSARERRALGEHSYQASAQVSIRRILRRVSASPPAPGQGETPPQEQP